MAAHSDLAKAKNPLQARCALAAALLACTIMLVQASPASAKLKASSMAPDEGTNGSIIEATISGTDFAAGAAVKLQRSGQSDITATGVVVVSAKQITCTFDLRGAATGKWHLLVSVGGSTAKKNNAFRITDAGLTVTGISPNSSSNDGSVSITDLSGTGFVRGATVRLEKAGEAALQATGVSVVNSTQITCVLDLAGAAAGAWDVVVTNTDGQSGTLAGGFTITSPAPTVTSITPGSAPNSGSVNVTDLSGTGFVRGATVRLEKAGEAALQATGVSVVSSTQITCALDLSGAATGAWDVVVTNADGQSGILAGGFTVRSNNSISTPTVSNITRTTAVVNWTTTIASSSRVGYDTRPHARYAEYPNRGFGPGNTIYHAVTLAALKPDTVYYLCVQSDDVESGTVSFTTSGLVQPSLTYSGDTTGTTARGDTVTLAATLTYGTGLRGEKVNFICGDYAATATTDAAGVASVRVSADRIGAGGHTVYCDFEGDAKYLKATATGSITLTGVPGSTIVRGTGYFNKGGDRTQRCTFSFRFNADLVAGWLIFTDVRMQKRVSVNVVKSIVLSPDPNAGPRATIVCGPNDEYTLVIDSHTKAFSITEGALATRIYSAWTSEVKGQITIGEETEQ